MKELTLKNFEEAAQLVKNVTLPTNLEYSESLSSKTGGKIYLKPENMQTPEPTRFAAHITKSQPLQMSSAPKALLQLQPETTRRV